MSGTQWQVHPFRQLGRRAAAAAIVFLSASMAAVTEVGLGAELQEPPIRSFAELRWLGVTRQDQPHTCGLAAWKTWVSALGISVDEAERTLVQQTDLGDGPSSLLDLYHLTRAAGLPVVPFRFSATGLRDYLSAERPPLLLHLTTGAGHFVVVSAPVDDGSVYMADPAAGWHSVPLDELLTMTSGSALVAATDWPTTASQDWAQGLAHALALGRTFQMLKPAHALTTEVGIEFTARLVQEIVPRPEPDGTLLPVVRPQWLPVQASLAASTRWGGRAGLSADIMASLPATQEPGADTGDKYAGIGLSWGGRNVPASTRPRVSLGYRWSERPPSWYMWEFALQEEVDTDPVRQRFGLAFSEVRSTSQAAGDGLHDLRLWCGAEVLLTPAFIVGGEVGLTVEDDGRVSIISSANCAWLRPEGHAWRLHVAWLAGQGVNIRVAYRHQWWSSRGVK